MEKNKKDIVIETVIIFFITFFLGSSLFITPFFGEINFIDEGQFGAWAYQMLNGKLMYQDIYITYGPLYVYPLFVLFKIFGPSAFLVRLIYVTINSALGITIVNLLLRQMEFKKITRWLVILLLFALPGISLRMGLGLLIILCLIKSVNEKKYLLSFLVGVLLFITFLISPEIGLFSMLLVFIFYFYFLITQADLKFILGKILWAAIGLILVLTLFFFWSFGEGWFSSYAEVTKDVLISLSGVNSPVGMKFPNPLSFNSLNSAGSLIKFIFSKEMLLYWELFFYILTFFYLITSKLLRKKIKNRELLFLLALYGFFLYTTLIGRPGHFFFAFSIVIIFGVYFAEELVKIYSLYKTRREERIISCFLLIILLIFTIRVIVIFRPHISRITQLPSNLSLEKNNPVYIGPISISTEQEKYVSAIQKFVWDNTKMTDKVFFLTDEPMMYLLVNRMNPTRFDLPFIANTKEKRLEILNDLESSFPRFIFENTSAWEVDGVSNRKRLPEIVDFIKRNYIKKEQIGSIIVFGLKP